MSEIIQGALIGIAGAIVGAIIAAISSYIITKSQINARREELSQQLNHQEREAKVIRLIEARKEHLFQLRRTMSDYVEHCHQEANMIVRLDKVIRDRKQPLEKEKEVDELVSVAERGKELLSLLKVTRGQLSDDILDDLITALLERQAEIDRARMPIIRFLVNSDRASVNRIELEMKKEESLRDEQRKGLLKLNKRIEELLSGEPSASKR